MNFDIIALIVLIVSFFCLSFLIFRKIPAVKAMPEPEAIFFKKELKKKIKDKTKEVIKERSNSFESLLHKLLSKIRILSLKTDKKMSDWITKLRERSLERTKGFDNYWKEIKASVKKKKD
jgi:methyl-accepting chemotaxis protein